MIIDEKGLVRAIKKVYTSEGYVVINHGAQLSIYSDEWYVRCDWDKLPRKALALIVEHTGVLPGTEATSVQKKDSPQIMMPDVVGNDISEWIEQHKQSHARRTLLSWGNLQIYQQDDGKCFGVNCENLEIVNAAIAEYNDATIVGESRMNWIHDGELIILHACGATWFSHRPLEQPIWDAFERIQMTQSKE